MTLSGAEQIFLDHLEGAGSRMEADLGKLVAVNSHEANPAGLDTLATWFEDRLEALGFRVAIMVSGGRGRCIVARRAAEGSHRLLLLGHLDTVHPPESPFRELRPDPGDGDRATGPGSADMKGGLVVLLHALEALHGAGALEGRQVTVVLNPDEEIGSPLSAGLIRAEAAEADLCLCFEPGRPGDAGATTFVTGRRGFGRFVLRARGRAAHAGNDLRLGASAVVELAHKVVSLSALSQPDQGVSVNVGVFRGGTAANTVAEEAEIHVDYRFPDSATQAELEDALFDAAGRACVRDGEGRLAVAIRIHDQVARPAMVRSAAMGRMADRIIAWGAELGQELVEEARGGSSDAAIAADVGCPAICGLGAVGDRFHTTEEWIERSSLVARARLAALTTSRFYEL